MTEQTVEPKKPKSVFPAIPAGFIELEVLDGDADEPPAPGLILISLAHVVALWHTRNSSNDLIYCVDLVDRQLFLRPPEMQKLCEALHERNSQNSRLQSMLEEIRALVGD